MSYLCDKINPFTCSDANKYVFWDSFHPTEKTNGIIAYHVVKNSLAEFLWWLELYNAPCAITTELILFIYNVALSLSFFFFFFERKIEKCCSFSIVVFIDNNSIRNEKKKNQRLNTEIFFTNWDSPQTSLGIYIHTYMYVCMYVYRQMEGMPLKADIRCNKQMDWIPWDI